MTVLDPPALVSTPQRPSRRAVRDLTRSGPFVAGAVILLFWAVCAAFGTHLAPYPPDAVDLHAINAVPSGRHLFGTDQLGRDVFSRVLVGSRSVLLVALSASFLGTAAGAVIGLLVGFFRGIVDEVAGRIFEAVIVLPLIVTALLVIAALGPSSTTVALTISVIFVPIVARTTRAAVLAEVRLDYLPAAQLRRESRVFTIFGELLPNVLAPILVEFTVRFGYAIFVVATLSFLGFGVQPPTPDWGLDVATNVALLSAGYWWEVAFAALAIASLIVGVNLISDSIERLVNR
ncbi:ABC transporter permease [Amycolatopsis saalfeldensis]|uniref:Peptide/nickel transport system permease protein n=1 Tax=Amycolatopsis saalfeldensis TaxID=394193 RepID=A0A1H8XY15_9PSEU|nr:ABC transporter permease [Amycolatopsis saalfeldensis]SEP44765.1 peptide/nickel transport system permease protein [Amycolatopsis saalfeldensis]